MAEAENMRLRLGWMQRILPLVCAAMMLLSSVAMAAEDMRFVDANGSTGYYVDVATISFKTANVVDANIAVIKAKENRRFIYAVEFDRENATYQIFQSTVQAYDTKEVIETCAENGGPQPYGVSSPMKSMVDFIFQFPHND